jgi:hypothetical protein
MERCPENQSFDRAGNEMLLVDAVDAVVVETP